MSDDITMAAVMECLAESDTIAASWKECKDDGNMSISAVIEKAKQSNPNDPDVQIVSDYLKSHNEVGGYIMNDCSEFGYDENHNGVVGSGEHSAEKYGRSILVSDGAIGSGSDKVWVGFNGSSKHEWIDNGEGLYQESTMAQRAAAAQFDRYVEEYNLKSNDDVVVTGHSKGGNKAMYVTMNSHYAKMIDNCVALDGQGFSKEAIDYWKEMYGEAGFEERRGKITLVSGHEDFVHELGINIAKNKITVDYGESGIDPVKMHGHQYMFQKDANGNFIAKFKKECKPDGTLEKILTRFMNSYMKLSTEERKNTAPAVMALLQKYVLGDGTTTNIDGKEIMVDIGNLAGTVIWALNDSGMLDEIAFLLCAAFPWLAVYILGTVAYLKYKNRNHDTSSKNDYAEGHARLILLNEESFIEMKSRFVSAFDFGKQASEYAKKAEALQTNPSIFMLMLQSINVKTDDIVNVMDVIINLFKQTDEDLAKKTERIGEDYLDIQVASGLSAGQNVFITGDGKTVVCPPAPDQSVIESGNVEEMRKCMNEYEKCFDAAYAA